MRGPVIAYDILYDDRFHGNGFIDMPGRHVSFEAAMLSGTEEQYGPLLDNETACSVIEADEDYLLAGVFGATSQGHDESVKLPDARHIAHTLKGLFERPWPRNTGEDIIVDRLQAWLKHSTEQQISVDYASIEQALPTSSIVIAGVHPAERRLEIARSGDNFALAFKRGGESELFGGEGNGPTARSLPVDTLRGVLLGTPGLIPQGWEIQNPDHRQRISNLLMYGGLKELIANCVVMADRHPETRANGKYRDHAAGVFLYL